MGSSKRSFSDRLTPGQVRQVLDALIEWRKSYNSDNNGWVNIPHEDFHSDLSVNINHGGWINQYDQTRGDIVQLVGLLCYSVDKYHKSIAFIKDVCGFNNGESAPDVSKGYEFANEWLKKSDVNFARLPMDILGSKLTSTQKIVWAAIFSRCNKDEIYSYPGIRRIASDTGLAKSTVQVALSSLCGYGLIIEKPKGHNRAPYRFPLVTDKETINKAIEGVD